MRPLGSISVDLAGTSMLRRIQSELYFLSQPIMRSWLVVVPFLNIIIILGAVKGSILLSRDVSREEASPKTTSNATTQRAHPLQALHISCDGSRYGWDLQERSCIDILSVMEEDPHIRTFGPRGFGPWDFPLPQRLVSSKSIKRGCFNNC